MDGTAAVGGGGGGGGVQVDAHDINNPYTWNIVQSTLKGNSLTIADDTVDFDEGSGSMKATLVLATFPSISRGRDINPNPNWSGYTNLTVRVKADVTASRALTIKLVDGSANEATSSTSYTPTTSYATATFPLSEFSGGGVDLSDVDEVYYIFAGPNSSTTVWHVDNLRAE